MKMDEEIAVSSIIDKLPPSWKKRTNFQNQNQDHDKKAKFACYHCGKPGHFKKDYRFLKKKKQASDSKGFVAMISEIFMLEEDGS
jgi:NAD(P)H-flavin reductase